MELVHAADFPFTEDGFHLRPHFLNGVEIRAIGRKIQQLHAFFLQDFPNGFDMMGTHIVHNDDIIAG